MQDVVVEDLVKRYSGRQSVVAADGTNLVIEAGEILVLLGPSGCGKTTLLRCIAGLEQPDSGRISLGGKVLFDGAAGVNLAPNHRQMGMVFQNYSLWPHMTVEKNVAYPLRAQRVPKSSRKERVLAALEAVHCEHLGSRYPGMLSGGQQQRIALARALVSNPAVLLLDEPLSNLDALLRIDLRRQLREIHRDVGFTGVYVTHDQSEAMSLGSRIAVMNAGRIEQLGTPAEVYRSPATEYVAGFLGIRNSLTARHRDGGWVTEAGPLSGALPLLADSSTSYRLFIRPEAVELRTADWAEPERSEGGHGVSLPVGTVQDAAFAGDRIDYAVDVAGVTIYAAGSAERPLGPGEAVTCHLSADAVFVYHDGRRVEPSRGGRSSSSCAGSTASPTPSIGHGGGSSGIV